MNPGESVRNVPREHGQSFETVGNVSGDDNAQIIGSDIDVGTHLDKAGAASAGRQPFPEEPVARHIATDEVKSAQGERSTSAEQLDEDEPADEGEDALVGFVVEPIDDALELPTKDADATIGTAPVSDGVKHVESIVRKYYAGMQGFSDEAEGSAPRDAGEGEGDSPVSSLTELTEDVQPEGLIRFSDVAVHDRYASSFREVTASDPERRSNLTEAARRLAPKLVRHQDVPPDQVVDYVRQLHEAPPENLIIDPAVLDTVIYGKPVWRKEAELIPDNSTATERYGGERIWFGTNDTTWTSYEIVKKAAECVQPRPGQKILDLGCGFGRLPIYLGMNYPDVTCEGVEIARERAQFAEETRQRHGLDNVKIYEGNVLEHDFSDADILFTYFPFTDRTGKQVLEQIKQHARSRAMAGKDPLTIIAHYGRLSPNVSYRDAPWLKQVSFDMSVDESYRSGLSFYQSVPDFDAYEKSPDDRVFKLGLREEDGRLEIEPDQIKRIVQAIHRMPSERPFVDNAQLDELIFGARCTDIEAKLIKSHEELVARYPGEMPWPGRAEGIWTPYRVIKDVITMVGPAKGQRIYDLGCGYGQFIMYGGITTDADYTGIELVSERAEYAVATSRRLGLENVTVLQGDVLDHDFSDADVIYMFLPFTYDKFVPVMKRIEKNAEQREKDGKDSLLLVARGGHTIYSNLPWLRRISPGVPVEQQGKFEIEYYEYVPQNERSR